MRGREGGGRGAREGRRAGEEGRRRRAEEEEEEGRGGKSACPPGKKHEKKTTAVDNDLVFVEASKPAKLHKIRASLCFANAAHTQAAHTTHCTPIIPQVPTSSSEAEWRSG